MKRGAFIRRFALGVMASGMLMDALVRGHDPLSHLEDDMIVLWVDGEPVVGQHDIAGDTYVFTARAMHKLVRE